jgi:hypothetical protein
MLFVVSTIELCNRYDFSGEVKVSYQLKVLDLGHLRPCLEDFAGSLVKSHCYSTCSLSRVYFE